MPQHYAHIAVGNSSDTLCPEAIPESSIEFVVSLRPTPTNSFFVFCQQADKSERLGATLGFLPEEHATCSRLMALRRNGYPQISPRFRRIKSPLPIRARHTATFASFSCYTRLSPLQDEQRGWHSLPTVVRRDPPRSKVIPHRGVYWRCQEFCTFEALLRAPRLELGSFSLVGSSRETVERFARTGIPHAASASYTPPRKGSTPLCTEVRRIRFNSQGTWLL